MSVKDEQLIWSKDATVRLASSTELEIALGSDNHFVSILALEILARTAKPIARDTLLDSLPASSPASYLEAAQLVNLLYNKGVLLGEHAAVLPAIGGFDSPPIHAAMLNDVERVRAYEKAINEVVGPNDIVIDIGTGTGVLAMLAARAGARHVYAIEEGGIAEAASRTFAASPFAERLTLLRGRSTKISVQEPATVIVSEILGHDPFDEGVLSIYRDASQRLADKTARWIPSRIDLFATLVEFPLQVLRNDTFCTDNLDRWSAEYDIPFGALSAYEQEHPYALNVKPVDFASWQLVSEPVRLVSADLTAIEHTSIEARERLVATRECAHVGVATYFEAELSETARLSTAPGGAHTSNHWKYRVYVSGTRKHVAKGEHVEICYEHGSGPTRISFC